jgi:hypothetical protein
MGASFEAEKFFANKYDELLLGCREAIIRSGFQLREFDPASGRVKAKAPMSWRSYGDNITIQVNQKGIVSARSECLNLLDFGKNKENITIFFDNLSALLIEISGTLPSTPSQSSCLFEIMQAVDVQEHAETIDIEEFPLDNRYGSDDLTVEHEFSKTVTNEISIEEKGQLQGRIGLDLLGILEGELIKLLSRQIGYTNGESTTRRYTARLSVKKGDFVVYTVVWRRKIRHGKYEVLVGKQRVVFPFRACFGLEYEVIAKKRTI